MYLQLSNPSYLWSTNECIKQNVCYIDHLDSNILSFGSLNDFRHDNGRILYRMLVKD